MYVLLPPSETKHPGGDGRPLDPDRLGFPGLNPVRHRVIAAAAALSQDLPAARAALKVSARMDHEIGSNAVVTTGPTLPALARYTGVLYTALDTPKLTVAERSRAAGRILITSAMFGLVGAGDLIPTYRLSAGSRLPGLPTMAALWRPALSEALAGLDAPVLDLRSGAYAAFAPAPGAVQVRVVTVTRGGEVKPVSHDNKAIKGLLARLVGTTRAEVDDIPALLRVSYRAGLAVKRTGPMSIDLTAPVAH
ncbi:hypothetical protein SAMN04515671_4150 [Nakamurella panacisegetis]|uniref:Peroxide stress protein YaaA n=1 Tax=Nakamurella panacisegetis TaxID=1090615 RepID=A0A1H0SLP9_9ACTN|nr:peroxide stress protein YaaA [Nakamurella panacisegetis]SDP42076.1 hypothetical protein SAMN04515671_4150 [Nakamurella panacisegetis]